MGNQQYRHTSEELENLLRNDPQAFKIIAKYYYENDITFFKSVVVPIIEDLKTNPDKYKTPPPQEIVESSLNLQEEKKSYKKHIIITLVIIFLFVITYLAIKDSQNNQKTKTNISIQKDTTTKINKPSINGVYEGYARDKQMYMVINNFDGKNFIGYCVIYWSSTKGTKAEFKGNYDETKDSIYIYESNDIEGAGKFEGKLKSNKVEGNWYRYSDNGSYSWSLQKSEKSLIELQKPKEEFTNENYTNTNTDIELTETDVIDKENYENILMEKYTKKFNSYNKKEEKMQWDGYFDDCMYSTAHYDAIKDFITAIKYYDELERIMLSYSDIYPWVYLHRGYDYYILGYYEQAISDFSKAIKYSEKKTYELWKSYYFRALIYLDKQNKNKWAVIDFDGSVDTEKNDIASYYYRGIAYHRIGNSSEACKNWEIAINLGDRESIILLNKYCK